MSTDTEIIAHALSLRTERRLRIAIDGHNVSVLGDDVQRTDLKAAAERGGGTYLTDGATFEAIVGYDIKNDLRRIVVYRLPGLVGRTRSPPEAQAPGSAPGQAPQPK